MCGLAVRTRRDLGRLGLDTFGVAGAAAPVSSAAPATKSTAAPAVSNAAPLAFTTGVFETDVQLIGNIDKETNEADTEEKDEIAAAPVTDAATMLIAPTATTIAGGSTATYGTSTGSVDSVGCGMSGALGGGVGGEYHWVARAAVPLTDEAPTTTTVAAPDEAYTATAAFTTGVFEMDVQLIGNIDKETNEADAEEKDEIAAAPVMDTAAMLVAPATTTIAGGSTATCGTSTRSVDSVGCGMSGALGGGVGGISYKVARAAAPLTDEAPATTTVAAPACTAPVTTTIAGNPSATYGTSTGSGVSVGGDVGGVLGDSVGLEKTESKDHQPDSGDARVGALAFLPEPPWSALALRSCSD